jgi:hypothetical protein
MEFPVWPQGATFSSQIRVHTIIVRLHERSNNEGTAKIARSTDPFLLRTEGKNHLPVGG